MYTVSHVLSWCRFTHLTTKEAPLRGFYAFEQGQLQTWEQRRVSRRVRNVEWSGRLVAPRSAAFVVVAPINTEILRYQNTLSLDSLKSLSLWYRGFIFRAQQFLVAFCGQCRVGNGVSECDIAHRAVWWQCTMGIERKSSNSSCKCNLQTREWHVQCCRLCRTTFHPRRASSPLIGWPGGLPRLWLVDQSCDVMLSRSTAAFGSVIHMPTIQGHHYQHYHQTPDNYKHLGDWWSDVLCS